MVGLDKVSALATSLTDHYSKYRSHIKHDNMMDLSNMDLSNMTSHQEGGDQYSEMEDDTLFYQGHYDSAV